jgi:hypothetical protein
LRVVGMTDDREISKAIEAGERNREVTELIHNWCTHARVEKFGGVGLIEMQTGLPIGHHSMACDHASAGGIAAWDLAGAALNFYDRNCVDCKFRSPRRLPNLTQLVRQRDEARERAEREREEAADRRARAFAARRSSRDNLRASVPSDSATVLEQLEELDRDPTDARREQLVQTARLAPEIFSKEIVDHLFSLLEAGEGWFTDVGLRTLVVLQADPAKLTRFALLALSRGFAAAEAAGDVLVAHSKLADPLLIPEALPALVLLAHPPRLPFSSSEPRALVQEPLLALYRSYPDAVVSGIHRLLGDRRPQSLRTGANAIAVIHGMDRTISSSFARSIIAILARAETMVDHDEYFGRSEADLLFSDLERALTLALETAPESTDAIVRDFMSTSRSKGQARILRAYGEMFRNRFTDERLKETTAHVVALKRLIDTASAAQEYEVLMEVLGLFRMDVPDGMDGLVRRELVHLIGAAVLMDARRSSLYAEARAAKTGLEVMEKRNLASLIAQLQEGFVKWCASAAADDGAATTAYIEVLRGIPDTQEEVRATMIAALAGLMTTSDGLNAALPPLYSALVGVSQRLRAAALEVFSELGRLQREDLPDLLHEAFVISLQDPYVIVHQAAVRSLDRFDVPSIFRPATGSLLRNLVLAYCHNREKHDDGFLMTCISLYVSRYATAGELAGDLGALLVSQMSQFEPYIVTNRLGWIHKKLMRAPGFAAMIIKLLSTSRSGSLDDQTVRVVRGLDVSALHAERDALQSVATQEAENRDLIGVAAELLTAAGAWEAAAHVANIAVETIPDTTRNKPLRLFMNLLRLAADYEMAVASGLLDSLPSIEQQWHATQDTIEQDRKENEKRRNPFPGFPGPDLGE